MSKRKKVIHKVPRKGEKFERTFKRKKYILTVVKNNKITQYEVNGKVYDSPSGAALAVTNNHTNGWNFWNIDK